jgi:hypothetical protein
MSNSSIAQTVRGASAGAWSLLAAFLLVAGVATAAWPADTAATPPAAAKTAPAAAKSTPAAKKSAPTAKSAKTPAGAAAAPAGTAADTTGATSPEAAPTASAPPEEFRSLDADVQDLKKEVLDLNKDLFVLEEELLFPANTQVAVYVSLDVGTFFNVDSVILKIDNKEVANYLYTAREAEALVKGGVHRVFIGNLKVGQHELVAFFTGKGPHERDYKRGATLNFEKGVGAKYLELKISDRVRKQQPEFIIKEWE